MNYRIAMAVGLVLAVAAAWLPWHLLKPAIDTSDIVEAPTGHAYQFISATDSSWEADGAAAARLSWHGHPDYRATIDDATEYQFVLDRLFPRAYPDVTYWAGAR